MSEEKPYVRIKEAAEQNGVTVAILKGWYNSAAEGSKPFKIKKLGRRLVVDPLEVKQAFDNLPDYVPTVKE